MQDAQEERLGLLCQLVANERDPQKLIELVREINKLVEGKRKRLIGMDTKEVDGNSVLSTQSADPSADLRDTPKTGSSLGRSSNE
jgi:hypothetical protein